MVEKRISLRNDPAYMLAVIWTLGFLAFAFIVVLKDTPASSAPIVQQIISIMSIIQTAIGAYFYGASKTAADTAKVEAAKTPFARTEHLDVVVNAIPVNKPV